MKLLIITPDGGFSVEGADATSIVKLVNAPPWVAVAIDTWFANGGRGNHEVHFGVGFACIVPEDKEREELEEMNDRKVQTYSDFHKDFYGHRPRVDPLSRSEIVEAYDRVSAAFQAEMGTPEGRARLRSNGWVVADEPAPPVKKASAHKGASKKAARRR